MSLSIEEIFRCARNPVLSWLSRQPSKFRPFIFNHLRTIGRVTLLCAHVYQNTRVWGYSSCSELQDSRVVSADFPMHMHILKFLANAKSRRHRAKKGVDSRVNRNFNIIGAESAAPIREGR